MEYERLEKEVARRSALMYIPVSLGAASLFYLAASLVGGYPPVARIGTAKPAGRHTALA